MKAGPALPRLRRKYEIDESYWLVRRWRSFSREAFLSLRRTVLAFKWRRIPKVWELSFIDRMRGLEKDGLTFDEILRSALPQLFGEDTSLVLRSWIGRKARTNPERFARSISKMFGDSARSVVVSIDKLTDENSLLGKKAPQEPPYKSLLDAIHKSDEVMTVSQPEKPQERP